MTRIAKVTVIVPCYNEALTIARVLETLRKTHVGREKGVIVVEDGSTDGSREILQSLEAAGAFPGLAVRYHDRNIGKGGAIQTALREAAGDVVIVQDADLEYTPADIRRLINAAEETGAPVVYGSRNRSIKNRASNLLYYVGTRLMDHLINVLYGQSLTDAQTCYKLINTNLLRFIGVTERGFGADMEMTLKVCQLGITIREVPISYSPRTFAEGKKIRARDGFRHLLLIVRYAFADLHFSAIDRMIRSFRVAAFRRAVPVQQTDVVVDVGCGRQAALGWLLRRDVSRYIGLDRTVPDITFGNITLRCGDAHELGFLVPSASADIVVALALIEHLEEPGRFLASCSAILRSGGTIALTTPTPKAKPILEFLAALHVIDAAEIREHKRYFSHLQLRALFEHEGFQVLILHTFLIGFNTICVARKP